MKILQSCGSPSWGGLEMQALLTSLELMKRGHDVSILGLPTSTLLREASEAGVPTVGLLGEDRNAFSTIRGLSRLFSSYNYDVVHTHLSHDLWWIVPALKFASSDSRLFLTKHMASGVKKTDPLHRFLYARLQGTFAISNYIRGSVLNTCPVPETDVHVVPPGIQMDRFDPSLYDKSDVRNELGIPENAVVVGMISRLSPGKGHEEFLRAASLIIEKTPLKIQFLVIGTSSKGEEQYEASVKLLAEELGLTNLVWFTGFRRDIPRLLAAMDILAFPSHEESFGLGLAEAMAMRVPVVASRSAGVLDIVVDNETGILFPPKEHQMLAQGISRLALNSELRQSFGEAGRRRVERYFSIGSVIDRLESHYSASSR